jgi:beta-carotene 3-hydroxylase
MRFVVILFLSFAAMEFISYLAHRFIYHGLGWVFHKSHHEPRAGAFEWNDIFPATFASITIALMAFATSDPTRSDILAMSIGISLYGLIYFIIHDLYVHRRAKWFRFRFPFLFKLKQAHAIHHRYGGEPYGLLLFFNAERVKQEKILEDEVV